MELSHVTYRSLPIAFRTLTYLATSESLFPLFNHRANWNIQ